MTVSFFPGFALSRKLKHNDCLLPVMKGNVGVEAAGNGCCYFKQHLVLSVRFEHIFAWVSRNLCQYFQFCQGQSLGFQMRTKI